MAERPTTVGPELEVLDLEVLPAWAQPRDHGRPRSPADRLSVRALDVRYGRRMAVLDVDLRVGPGEVVALIGHNGCGKTSTLRAIFGLHPTDRGEVLVNGVETAGDGRAVGRPGMAMVLASRTVFAELTVRENLGLGARHELEAVVAERLARVLALFPGLEASLARRAGDLSGGEQRMVGVGIALMSEPSVLLLDEPTRFLAPAAARQVLDAVRRLADERGTGVLLADVNVAAALSIADRVYVMANGRIRSQHDPADLRAAGPTTWWHLF